jgi:hypothetical protein
MGESILRINRRVFCSGEQFARLMETVEQDYTLDLGALARLIAANYLEAVPPRPIFSSADITGQSFI